MTSIVVEFNSTVWKHKKECNQALNQPLTKVYASPRLKSMKRDLQAMHRIEDLQFGTPHGAETTLKREGETYIAE
jgi:hypothetical protein